MRKSFLMCAAAVGLALPAMAQTMPNAQAPQPGMSAQQGGQGDMTGMHPMRHPRGERAAQQGRMRHGGQGMGEAADSDRGFAEGLSDSPRSRRASNINGGDTRGEIAPALPVPNVSSNTPEAYLAAADRALAQRRTGAAQEALERAETRLLDRSVPMGQGNAADRDPRVDQISSARQALSNRNYAGARQSIQQAMAMGGSGMGQGGMSQGGMSQQGMGGQGGMNQGGMGQGGMGQGGMMQPGMGGGQTMGQPGMRGQPGMAPPPGTGLPR